MDSVKAIMVYGLVRGFRLWTFRKGGKLRRVVGYAFVVWEAFTKRGYALGPTHVMLMDVQKNITYYHDTEMDGKQPEEKAADQKESDKQLPTPPREGAVDSRTNVTDGKRAGSEMVSLRTIPVWLKKNNRKVKVNAILDDASNETVLNEEVAGMLGIQEPFQTVTTRSRRFSRCL